MNSTSYGLKLRRYALLALVATIAVSLTACSDLLKEQDKLASELAPKVVQNDVKTPDIPAHLVKCVQAPPKPGETANEKVVNLKLTAEERKKCAVAILAWYKEIQKANKTASAAPKKG